MFAYIYTIHDAYVGSTKNVNKRFDSHKSAYTNPTNADYNKKLYQYLRENGLEIEMNVIDTCPIDEQYIIEQEWMDKLQLEYNDRRAYSTPEQIKARHKEWLLENKEHVKKQKAEHRLDTIKAVRVYETEYRKKNKKKISKFRKTLITCECGKVVCYGAIHKHRESKKHLKYISHLISKTT